MSKEPENSCGVCGSETNEVHVRVLFWEQDSPACYYALRCANNMCKGVRQDTVMEGNPNSWIQWSKWIRDCNCTKISISGLKMNEKEAEA